MKYIKSIYESASKADYNNKIIEIKANIKDTHAKMNEITDKVRDEIDPLKNELLNLGLQKEDLKMEMLRVDLKINKIKREQV